MLGGIVYRFLDTHNGARLSIVFRFLDTRLRVQVSTLDIRSYRTHVSGYVCPDLLGGIVYRFLDTHNGARLSMFLDTRLRAQVSTFDIRSFRTHVSGYRCPDMI